MPTETIYSVTMFSLEDGTPITSFTSTVPDSFSQTNAPEPNDDYLGWTISFKCPPQYPKGFNRKRNLKRALKTMGLDETDYMMYSLTKCVGYNTDILITLDGVNDKGEPELRQIKARLHDMG